MTPETDSRALEAGYTRSHRRYECLGLGLAAVCLATACLQAVDQPGPGATAWLTALVAGVAFADLISGLVHWGFDTWGSVDTPIVGQLAIRTFRQHHLDPEAMVAHDFVETNGHNAMLSALLTGPAAFAPELLGPWLTVFLFWAGLFVALTSQLHKWAHSPQPPAPIRWLQRYRLVLSREAHAGHHGAPHDGGYCVTTGWMNGPLDRLRFFRGLEHVVSLLTGATPNR